MAWGAIAHGVKGPIVILETSQKTTTATRQKQGGDLNAKGYTNQVISRPLKEFWQQLTKEQGHDMFIVEDGAPLHKGRAAQKAQDELGMKHLLHPPNSPDLNPIEPIWHILKKHVAKVPGYCKNCKSLQAAIKTACDSIDVGEINKHTSKMDAHVKAVKAAHGRHTHF
ncbi:DDE superfamily endonuclease [Ceratobasidium sp. AG-Ba]|nr:DDE superfamily endonuclease [Ceratobasidium sp. AG-Ba]